MSLSQTGFIPRFIHMVFKGFGRMGFLTYPTVCNSSRTTIKKILELDEKCDMTRPSEVLLSGPLGNHGTFLLVSPKI